MSKQKKDPGKKEDSWGKSLAPIFKFTSWIHKHRIYRIMIIFPALNVKIFGRLFGTIFLHFILKSHRKIIPSLSALFPEKSPKEIRKIYMANIAFFGQFLMQTIFRTARISPDYVRKMTQFKNLDFIDKALEKGRGVVIASLHISNFIEAMIGGLVYHEKRYKVAVVASLSNMNLFSEILKRPIARDLVVLGSTGFKDIKMNLMDQLSKNHIVIIMYDYTTEAQLRVPFWQGKYPYLQHTPQSVASMHRNTKAPIFLAITHPNEEIGRSIVEFKEIESIREISRTYWNVTPKEFYGRLSTEINKQINKYLRMYPHLWEEIMNFHGFRVADKIQFESGVKIHEFLSQIQTKMIEIIDRSFEPNRKDKEILDLIQQNFPKILNSLEFPNEILREYHTKIDLSLLDGISELLKLCHVAEKELKAKNQFITAKLMHDLSIQIKNFYPKSVDD